MECAVTPPTRLHGIDFVEAQALWLDVDRLELLARPMDEPRALIIGRIGQTHGPHGDISL